MPNRVSADEATSAAPETAVASRWVRPGRISPDSTAPASPAAVSTSAISISFPGRPVWYGSAVSPSRRSSMLLAVSSVAAPSTANRVACPACPAGTASMASPPAALAAEPANR